jgi:hypothetical protein
MARKYDPETFEDEDTAPVPARIFKAAPLRIDEHIKRRINAARKPSIRADLNESSAVGIGRYILRLAIVAAAGAKSMNPPAWRKDWRSIQDAGNEAAEAIDRLMSALSKDDASGSRVSTDVIVQIRATDSLDIIETLEKAKRDAGILEDAGRLSKGLAVCCSRRLAEISKAHPRAIDVEKNTFVMKLAQGWTYLMEAPPGLTTTAHENPFLQFVEAAWLDWKDTGRLGEESFVQALIRARKALTTSSVASIVNDHPFWRRLPSNMPIEMKTPI